MAKNELEKYKNEYIHSIRKYSSVFEKMSLKSKDKNTALKDYFNNAFKHELLYCYKGIIASKCCLDNGHQYTSFYMRKFLEAYSVLFADKEKQFLNENYQLFKIMSQGRDIGKRESDKLKLKFKIKSPRNLKEIFDDNPYLFLTGATNNVTTPAEILRNIETECEAEEVEKDKILESYRFTSCLIHYVPDYNENKNFSLKIKSKNDGLKQVVRHYLKDELKDSSKLAKMPNTNETFINLTEKYGFNFAKYTSLIFKMLESQPLNRVFYEGTLFFNNFFLFFSLIYQTCDYSYALCIPKMFFEKAIMYFEMLNFSDTTEMRTRYFSYVYLINKKIELSDEELFNDKEVNLNIEKIYRKFFEYKYTNTNYYDFRNHCLISPIYLLYNKQMNYTDLANLTINYLKDEIDPKLMMDLYNKSVKYSHAYGLSLLIDEEKSRLEAIKVFYLLATSYICYLNKLKDNFIVKINTNDEISLPINYLVSIINDIKKELTQVYLDITGEELLVKSQQDKN